MGVLMIEIEAATPADGQEIKNFAAAIQLEPVLSLQEIKEPIKRKTSNQEERSLTDLIGVYTLIINSTEQVAAAANALAGLLKNLLPLKPTIKVTQTGSGASLHREIEVTGKLATSELALEKILKECLT